MDFVAWFYPLTIIDWFFFILSGTIICIAVFIKILGSWFPACLKHICWPGKLQPNAKKNFFLKFIEVPKSSCKYIYVAALISTVPFLFLMLQGIFLKQHASECVIHFLDVIGGGKERLILVHSGWGLATFLLFTLQVCRRFYEVYFMQLFSSKYSMNFLYLPLGILYYLLASMTFLANTEGFVRGWFAYMN